MNINPEELQTVVERYSSLDPESKAHIDTQLFIESMKSNVRKKHPGKTNDEILELVYERIKKMEELMEIIDPLPDDKKEIILKEAEKLAQKHQKEAYQVDINVKFQTNKG